jgi:hypothetical protein
MPRSLFKLTQEVDMRNSYEPIPPANPVGGAFGERKRDTHTDEDVSLAANTNFHQQSGKGQNT